jgi:undecaprenyl pyrophosphate phosphatase UppP
MACLQNLIVIAASLVTLAAFSMLAERVAKHSRNLPDLNGLDAIIGVTQTLALIPGSSRSGQQ